MEIIPAGWADQVLPTSNIRTRVYFVVYAELDEDKLKSALGRLLRYHSRKLGGRLVPNPKTGRLEYQIPHSFADDYDIFKWSSSRNDKAVPIPDVTESTALGTISLHPPAGELCSSFTPADWPLDFQPGATDVPLLWVHLSYYSDATVIGVNIPHVVSDQMGLASIVKAWLGVVKGEEPPNPLQLSDDDLISNNEQRLSQTQRKGQLRVFNKWEVFWRNLGFLREIITDPKDVVHSVFIPMPLVEDLLTRCRKDCKSTKMVDISLTKADIVAAIIMKLSLLCKKAPRKIHFFPAINLRGRIRQLPKDQSLYHNAVIFGGAQFLANRETPLSEFALQHRQSIINGLDPKVLEVSQAVVREYARRGQALMFCEPGHRMSHVTNWTAAWHGIDFSPVVKRGPEITEAGSMSRSVRMVVLGQSREPETLTHRFDSQVMCKTAEGYWCNFGAGSNSMGTVKEFLSKNPRIDDEVICWQEKPCSGTDFLRISIIVVLIALLLVIYTKY